MKNNSQFPKKSIFSIFSNQNTFFENLLIDFPKDLAYSEIDFTIDHFKFVLCFF